MLCISGQEEGQGGSTFLLKSSYRIVNKMFDKNLDLKVNIEQFRWRSLKSLAIFSLRLSLFLEEKLGAVMPARL